jgi:hypothetical protein
MRRAGKEKELGSEETERAIEDFLGDSPRAAQWRALRQALSERLAAQRREYLQKAESGAEPGRLRSLKAQIASMERQLTALETEDAVSQFVEDSIKVTVARSEAEEED